MNDKNKLICKELRIAHAGHSDEGPSTFSDAAEALETERDALQAEVERLNKTLEAHKDTWLSWEAKRSALEAAAVERDALQAQLAAAQGQEPIAYRLTNNLGNGRQQFAYVETIKGAYLDNCLEYAPLYAAPIPQQPAQGVPEGWRLVPIEPTTKMKEVGASINSMGYDFAHCCYSQMIAAAPQPKDMK